MRKSYSSFQKTSVTVSAKPFWASKNTKGNFYRVFCDSVICRVCGYLKTIPLNQEIRLKNSKTAHM